MTKVLVTICMEPEAKELIKEQGPEFNFSAWVEQGIYSTFQSTDHLRMLLGKKLQETEHLKEQIALLDKYDMEKKAEARDFLKSLTGDELSELRQAKALLRRNPVFLKGRVSKFNNEFNKSIGKIEYLKLLEQI